MILSTSITSYEFWQVIAGVMWGFMIEEIINKILIGSVSSLFNSAISIVLKSNMHIEKMIIILLSIFIITYILFDCYKTWKRYKKEQEFKQENRGNKITSWRGFIDTQFNWDTFRDTLIFSEMKPYLPEKMIKEIDPYSFGKKGEHVVHLRSVIGRDDLKMRLLDEITKIEKKWNLF